MMEWNERIDLSISLMQEVADILSNINISVKGDVLSDELKEHVTALKQYIIDSEMISKTEEEKTIESICILKDAIETVFTKMVPEQIDSKPEVQYMTFEQASQKLFAEYKESIERGNDDVAAMNINDWFAENNIVLIDNNQNLSSAAEENR